MQLRQTKNYIKKVYINKLAKAVLRQKKTKIKRKDRIHSKNEFEPTDT